MSGNRARKLDPTALYAAAMTIACLLVSSYPAPARSGLRVAANESTCSAVDAKVAVTDSIAVATRSAVLGPAPDGDTGGR